MAAHLAFEGRGRRVQISGSPSSQATAEFKGSQHRHVDAFTSKGRHQVRGIAQHGQVGQRLPDLIDRHAIDLTWHKVELGLLIRLGRTHLEI